MKLTEIKEGILKKLELNLQSFNLYSEESSVSSTDEYILLSLIPKRVKNINPFHSEKLITAEIKYYSKNKTNNENIEMADTLNNIFDLKLNIVDRVFPINNINMKIIDNILYFFFDIKFIDSKDTNEESYEKMQELIMKEE